MGIGGHDGSWVEHDPSHIPLWMLRPWDHILNLPMIDHGKIDNGNETLESVFESWS